MPIGKLNIACAVALLTLLALASAWAVVPCEPGCSDCACHCDCTCCPASSAVVVGQAAPPPDWTVGDYVATELPSVQSLPLAVIPQPPRA